MDPTYELVEPPVPVAGSYQDGEYAVIGDDRRVIARGDHRAMQTVLSRLEGEHLDPFLAVYRTAQRAFVRCRG